MTYYLININIIKQKDQKYVDILYLNLQNILKRFQTNKSYIWITEE